MIPNRRTKPRRGPLRDPAYRRYLRDKPCVVCGWLKCDAAHTENNGLSSKGPDSSCVPLCRDHHREYDSGRAAFEARRKRDMREIAAKWWAKYQTSKTLYRIMIEKYEPITREKISG